MCTSEDSFAQVDGHIPSRVIESEFDTIVNHVVGDDARTGDDAQEILNVLDELIVFFHGL